MTKPARKPFPSRGDQTIRSIALARAPESRREIVVPDKEHFTIALQSGWLVLNRSEAFGGVRYERENTVEYMTGAKKYRAYKTRKIVDDKRIVDDLDGLAKKADHACRSLCVDTVPGWFINDTTKIRARFEELKREAAAANARAVVARSEHRILIECYFAWFDTSDAANTAGILRTISGALLALYKALRAGSIRDDLSTGRMVRNQYRVAMLRAARLEMVATGSTQKTIRDALALADVARDTLRVALDDKGWPPDVEGEALDLRALKKIIRLFGGKVQ